MGNASRMRLKLATLSTLATFTTAFAATMPSVTVDVQKVDETVEPVPMMERFTFEAKDGLLLRNGKPFFWTSDGASLGGVHSTPLGLWLANRHVGRTASGGESVDASGVHPRKDDREADLVF